LPYPRKLNYNDKKKINDQKVTLPSQKSEFKFQKRFALQRCVDDDGGDDVDDDDFIARSDLVASAGLLRRWTRPSYGPRALLLANLTPHY